MGDIAVFLLEEETCRDKNNGRLTGTFLSPRNAPARTYKFMRIQATASRRNASRDSDACSFSER